MKFKNNVSYTVELKNINKIYPGVHALKNINFQLSPGEVHCLVGENGSGKSTLIKVLSGVESPEQGAEIFIDGVLCAQHNCESALLKGIQVIYQDIALFPNLTVKENIAFRHYTHDKNIYVNWKRIDIIAQRALEEIGISLDINQKVGSLSIAQQQLVEIARSLTGNIKLLILDEPTASLTRKEVNALFRTIEKLSVKNIAILFVSHKLNEIFEIAEKVTILRDGNMVGAYHPSDLDYDKITYLMTGAYEVHTPLRPIKKDVPLLRVEHLSKKNNYEDINFHVSKGEILGITGLLGSGRTELALSLFGLLAPDSGKMYLEDKLLGLDSHTSAKKKGIAYVPENRRDDGLIQEQSIADNISLTTMEYYLNIWGLIDEQKRHNSVLERISHLGVKGVHDTSSAVNTLSGGNQQKIVLAKWIAIKPKLLILDEPTVGIDIIAKNSIHQLIKQEAEEGMGIIMISDEVQEVLYNCHRVLIMKQGRIVYEFFPHDVDEQVLFKTFNLG